MAGSRTYRTKVLVLDKTKLKETDLILTMLDERGRQVRAVAKGAFTFAITQRALTLVGSGLDSAHMDLLVAAFVFKLLSHVGYRPDFSACVSCGDPMLSHFSAQAGGLLCGSCASSVPGAELVSVGEVAWLRALMSMTFDALLAERIDPHTAAFLLGLSHVWAATHTDQRLRAMEFMLGR